ncbi:MAG: hypothetical protein SF182_26035 [Deltaproteobacteria bacterium]|nr:hypothetical protein [Deltaproteobacteria bacterium]
MVFLPLMEAAGEFEALVGHLERTTRLNRAEAERVVAEVLAYFCEPLEGFVARRHAELQAEELKNPEIFARILAELRARRFAAPPLSERQIRRMVYG